MGGGGDLDLGWRRMKDGEEVVCVACFRDDVLAVHNWAIGMGVSCCIFFGLVCLLAIGMHRRRKLVAHYWGLGFVGERREGIRTG